MKKKIKGFTIIELIVVMAILSTLAAIIIPQLIKYADNARVSKLNSNARHVFGAAAYAAADCAAGSLPGDVLPNTIYTGSDTDLIAYSSPAGAQFSLKNYLGNDFTGSFAIMTDSTGCGCVYTLWSKDPIAPADVAQLSIDDVESSMTVGCYPLDEAP